MPECQRPAWGPSFNGRPFLSHPSYGKGAPPIAVMGRLHISFLFPLLSLHLSHLHCIIFWSSLSNTYELALNHAVLVHHEASVSASMEAHELAESEHQWILGTDGIVCSTSDPGMGVWVMRHDVARIYIPGCCR